METWRPEPEGLPLMYCGTNSIVDGFFLFKGRILLRVAMKLAGMMSPRARM